MMLHTASRFFAGLFGVGQLALLAALFTSLLPQQSAQQPDPMPPGMALQATVDSLITQVDDVRQVEHVNHSQQQETLWALGDEVGTLSAGGILVTPLPSATPTTDYPLTLTAVYSEWLTAEAVPTQTPQATLTPDYFLMTEVANITYTETPQATSTPLIFPTPTQEVEGLEGDWAVVIVNRLNVRECASQTCRAIPEEQLLLDHRVNLRRETCQVEESTLLEWCERQRGGWVAVGIAGGDQYVRWE